MEIGAVAGIIGGFDAVAPLTITLSAPPGVASRQPAQSGVVLSCYGHSRPSPAPLITRRVHVSRQSVRFVPLGPGSPGSPGVPAVTFNRCGYSWPEWFLTKYRHGVSYRGAIDC